MLLRFRSKADPASGSRPSVPHAFAAEALLYVDSLYGTAVRLVGNRADAEDLVQETYLKAFKSAAQFQAGTNLKAWLFAILHNTYRNARRDGVRDPVSVDSEVTERAASLPDRHATPEQILLRKSLDADLRIALESLPVAFREAVWLRDVEEFSYAEIADMMEVPVGTVMSRISRGRRLLHEGLTARASGVEVG